MAELLAYGIFVTCPRCLRRGQLYASTGKVEPEILHQNYESRFLPKNTICYLTEAEAKQALMDARRKIR